MKIPADQLKQIRSILEDLPIDLRAEVVVADLLKKGYRMEELFIKPVGIFKRRFNKDIAKLEEVELVGRESIQLLQVNREGLYDILPQAVFHYPAKKPKAFKTTAEMVGEVKQRIREEQEARNFFFAYESEFFRERIALELQERKFLDTITHNMTDEGFLSYWEIPEFFDNRQKGILFYLLPVFHRIRSDLALMEEAYSTILKDKISLRNMGLNTLPIEAEVSCQRLGSVRLSIDSVLGTSSFNIYETIDIQVELMSGERIPLYLPGGIHLAVLRHLNSLFLPLHIESRIRVLPVKREWTISSKSNIESRLGYSTCV